ncbi:hypothetical protein AB6A40_000921 [Gnathostoma spinigerum]|uniref:Innexin n=1 Tax=Gnathostoma spinigerum TaxID=75299 RepID=A0ABD6ECI3_9BILA
MLNSFLETTDYPLFGGHVLYDLIMAREWKDSGKFPRVTLCDFEIRVLGNVHRHTVQCVLVINMFTEKIFIFLWLWLLMLSVCTGINLTLWFLSLLLSTWRHAFVSKFLECQSDQTYRFVHHFLRPDGVLLLHMIASHAGNAMCARLTESLWMRFLQRCGKVALFDDGKSADIENETNAKMDKIAESDDWQEPDMPLPMPRLLPTSS